MDGQLEDRNVGERNHSKLQCKIQILLSRTTNLSIFPAVRVRVSANRVRVPDIAVYLTEPAKQVFVTPPYLVIEILSPEDRWSRMLSKLEDYLGMGCQNIWVFDPAQKAYRFDGNAVHEVHDEITTTDFSIRVKLSDLW